MKLLEDIDKMVGKTAASVDPCGAESEVTITFTDDTCIKLASEEGEIDVVQERELSLEQKQQIGIITSEQYNESMRVARKNKNALREIVKRQDQYYVDALAVMLEDIDRAAENADLDGWADIYDITRDDGETDATLRKRILTKIRGFFK